MISTPLETYQKLLDTKKITPDAQQLEAVKKLDTIHRALHQPNGFFGRFIKKPTKGLYMWGSVGIGKTFLMDLLYEHLNVPKMRLHFFTFMRDIHASLTQKQGQKNPLQLIAKEISEKAKVICFDEFFVKDIADAMILGELFKLLFDQGIVLVTTSNIAPDDLYKNGLQRERFLPAIEAIKKHTDVLHLAKQHDYRQLHEKPGSVYFFPIDEYSKQAMTHAFLYHSENAPFDTESLEINSHTLPIIRKSRATLWCEFDVLCKEERSQNDYLVLASQFKTLLINNITPIPPNDRQTILRFIHLIDILYDKHCRVIISAQTTINEFYTKGPYTFEFQRTLSRLTEMQSADYINDI